MSRMFLKKLQQKILIPITCACIILPGTVAGATGTINNLQNKSNALQQELSSQQNQFVGIISQINEIEEDIKENQESINETELNLVAAQEAEQRQYEQMKTRIRYNYENKEESLFNVLLTSRSFSDFLNQVEYANSIYEYDSQMLDSYEATRIEIQEMKADLEAQKASLNIKQGNLNAKKQELSALIEDTKNRKADVDSELAEARAEAARRAAAEAAARAAARAAQRAAASAASANAAAAASNNRNNGGGSGGNNSSSGNSSGGSSSGGSSSGGSKVTNADPAPTTGVSGSSVVSYASQFVGNPYVWGGNSLTNGCDCSGFVVQVYKHFGINLGGSRNSSALRSVGKAVSYDNMKAGDIICYSGHVGIYTGAGTIVEAQSSKAGITMGRSVNCKTILAIRRVI